VGLPPARENILEHREKGEIAMRYRIISAENIDGQNWIRQDIASFRDEWAAISFCKDCPVSCYCVDILENKMIARNY